jgi:hypothetical protein
MLADAAAPAVLVLISPLAVMLADAGVPAVLAPSPRVWMGALVRIMISRELRVYGRKLLNKTNCVEFVLLILWVGGTKYCTRLDQGQS